MSRAGATAKSAKTLRRQLADVQAFALALRRLLSVMKQTEGSYIFGDPGRWVPTPGRETEYAKLRNEVDLAAGRATPAFASTGQVILWKPRGRPDGYWQPVNPAAGWTTILSDDPMFDADTILANCDQAVGMLDAKAADAEEHEQSFEGRIAHVTEFWSRVKPTGRTQSAGFVQGVAVTVVGGALLALLLHFFG